MYRKQKIKLIALAVILCVVCSFALPLLGYAEGTLSPEIQSRISNAIVLKVGSPKALVNNTAKTIDSNNLKIQPVLRNNTTFVPVRFVSESLGANVSWDGKTSTVNISLNGQAVRLALGSKTMFVNNTAVQLLAAPFMSGDRVFVPLRAVSQAFGKQVFYDRGLIIISNTYYLFNINTERAMLDELSSWFGAAASNTARIVNPNQVYTYEILTNDIKKLQGKYPDLIHYQSIGRTAYNREIWAVRLGNGNANVIINDSHHAREWLTTNLIMYMIEQYAIAYNTTGDFAGMNVKQLLDQVSIWFVPMVNPDGVTLQQKGVSAFPAEISGKLISMNKGSTNFKRWKANINGIDLNRQYPAGWEPIPVTAPSYQDYKGPSPLYAAEAQAMVSLTRQTDPEIVVAYHTAGKVIYWHYATPPQFIGRDWAIANTIAKTTGYTLMQPTSDPAGGGYKDWFVQTYNRPGLTIEIGPYVGETNVPLSYFNAEWEANKKVGLLIANEALKLWSARQ